AVVEFGGNLNVVTDPTITANIDDFRVYEAPSHAIVTGYSKNITFNNDTLLGDLSGPPSINSFGIDGTNQDCFTFNHVDVRGYDVGIRGPYIGTSSIVACTFQDLKAIYITPDNDNNNRVIRIADDPVTGDKVTFLDLPPKCLGTNTQYDIYLEPSIDLTQPNIAQVFNPVKFISTLGTVTFDG